ncbi:MAG: hypothetical protein C0603_11090 [Denitrovibrio sp.]|nr:MAG: hypothetical protein C0603_11090 [Denitrovibrio sp.]
MIKKLIIYVTLSILLTANAYAVSAKDIIKQLDTIKSYTANFTQFTEIEGFGEDEYSGKMYINSGEKAYWNYEKPYRQFYLFDTNTMKYYDSDTRQLVVQTLTPATNVFMRLMLNPADIENDFDVKLKGNELILTPRNDLGVETISFIVVDGLVKGIRTKDQNGNNTRIEMSNVVSGEKLRDDIFDPEIPEGTEIFEYN